MDARGGCATKGDARRRRRDKRRRDNQPANIGQREEMRQRTRGGGALISRGCGGGRVERMIGGGVNMTTSRQTRGNDGYDEGEGIPPPIRPPTQARTQVLLHVSALLVGLPQLLLVLVLFLANSSAQRYAQRVLNVRVWTFRSVVNSEWDLHWGG